ncbi:hypothetical protein ACPW96_19135 [Micromonospora sp. DT81.3]|uniref:hypothetical protein n=1 Tax=Micromonospora sp. DT81.3 TaxID=3416523 RepID=UPI003CEF7FE6
MAFFSTSTDTSTVAAPATGIARSDSPAILNHDASAPAPGNTSIRARTGRPVTFDTVNEPAPAREPSSVTADGPATANGGSPLATGFTGPKPSTDPLTATP